jgi:hypothetical protein
VEFMESLGVFLGGFEAASQSLLSLRTIGGLSEARSYSSLSVELAWGALTDGGEALIRLLGGGGGDRWAALFILMGDTLGGGLLDSLRTGDWLPGTGDGVLAAGTGDGVLAAGTGDWVLAAGTGDGVLAALREDMEAVLAGSDEGDSEGAFPAVEGLNDGVAGLDLEK